MQGLSQRAEPRTWRQNEESEAEEKTKDKREVCSEDGDAPSQGSRKRRNLRAACGCGRGGVAKPY